MSISTESIIKKLEQALHQFKQADTHKQQTSHMSKIQILAELWLETDDDLNQQIPKKPSVKRVLPEKLSHTRPTGETKKERDDGTSIFDF